MDDNDAVAREVHVELQTVGAERHPLRKGVDGVLRRKRTPATMREHQRARCLEEREAPPALGPLLHRYPFWSRRDLESPHGPPHTHAWRAASAARRSITI